jgi:hypothetical protein
MTDNNQIINRRLCLLSHHTKHKDQNYWFLLRRTTIYSDHQLKKSKNLERTSLSVVERQDGPGESETVENGEKQKYKNNKSSFKLRTPMTFLFLIQ